MAKRYNSGFYEGMSERRRQEHEDGGMIKEDHSAIANLPQQVIIKAYPKGDDYTPEKLNDTITGIDRQKSRDHSQTMKHLQPEKY